MNITITPNVQDKYYTFISQVQQLLTTYEKHDYDNFNLIAQKLKQADWDKSLTFTYNNRQHSIDISQLLAYEYCLGASRITHGKVSFNEMANLLFDRVKAFKFGNPDPNTDFPFLYDKSLDDEGAIPVTSKKYRLVMPAGAQHLSYVENGKVYNVIYIYKKGKLENSVVNPEGNLESTNIPGIDFDNLAEPQSLLTNLRQTAFHEIDHSFESDIIDPEKSSLRYEYKSPNGITYRNYRKSTQYVYLDNPTFDEPEYHYEIDYDGKKHYYYFDENNNKHKLDDFKFNLPIGTFEKPVCISQGMETAEPDPNVPLHNIITEGFVEATARAIVRAIDPTVPDLDTDKYPELVALADSVISARDATFEPGTSYADFLTHSSVIKIDLESRTVTLPYGSRTDGLHYIADYAELAQNKKTAKRIFLQDKHMMEICSTLGLNESQAEELKNSGLFSLPTLSNEQKSKMANLLLAGTNPDKKYVDSLLSEYFSILEEEKAFFDGISTKLGYRAPSQGDTTCPNPAELDER